MRGAGSVSGRGGAPPRTPGWAPLPVRLLRPSATSFQPCPPVGAACGAAAAASVPAAALSPSFPFPPDLGFARHGFTHCSRPALGSQGELGEGARRPGVGLRRPRVVQRRGLPPASVRAPARRKAALFLAGRQPRRPRGHVLRCPSGSWAEATAASRGLLPGAVGRPSLPSPRVSVVGGEDV